ncbi:L-2-hydroxyglutarate oxidase [Nodosilinea sp. PGN35]|uniref:L-2-hydroxyglutarate oxidase n=1 Tax=Nodosilinea sp. PGN35 TaxID=3020489 RepID=UPI0023B3017E|nr:L-2-hydroxyglutarate oxidase [Nodosilinea sp. TSF1-S3]MDF0367581.1 L-2-hydroxyglutarate oxidase [Nodosilinea sp. TSF1-S3]
MSNTYDYAIVGGGIVGLATAMKLSQMVPSAKITVIEKESSWAYHQTGNNSGVIHSGIYYKPGSFKAKFSRAGCQSMVDFCRQHDIPYDVCGKVIVATQEKELPLLENLFQRGLQNEIPVSKITPAQVREIEPYVSCIAAVKVDSTGIVNYKAVCQKYIEIIQQADNDLRLNTKVLGISLEPQNVVLETNKGTIKAKFLINCAGLFSDRVAQMANLKPSAKIVPFRGEYYELVPEKRHMVNTLIYPVPNPSFPFLGVHFTKMIDGSVHAGPNAVLSLKREGYKKTDFDLKDFAEVMAYPGFWKLASKHADEGIREIVRSFSKAAFVKSLQRLIPEVRSEDVVPTHAGVRAQALMNNGSLVDDFLIVNGERSIHVLNAPSPAATSSLEIGKEVASQVVNATAPTSVAL